MFSSKTAHLLLYASFRFHSQSHDESSFSVASARFIIHRSPSWTGHITVCAALTTNWVVRRRRRVQGALLRVVSWFCGCCQWSCPISKWFLPSMHSDLHQYASNLLVTCVDIQSHVAVSSGQGRNWWDTSLGFKSYSVLMPSVVSSVQLHTSTLHITCSVPLRYANLGTDRLKALQWLKNDFNFIMFVLFRMPIWVHS